MAMRQSAPLTWAVPPGNGIMGTLMTVVITPPPASVHPPLCSPAGRRLRTRETAVVIVQDDVIGTAHVAGDVASLDKDNLQETAGGGVKMTMTNRDSGPPRPSLSRFVDGVSVH
eukprot:4476858-Prymnesium_polylepis.1